MEMSTCWQLFLISHNKFVFKTMLIIIDKVLSYIWIRIIKGQLRGRNILERDLKYKENLEKILKYDIGYIDFKNIWIYHDYL
jgi:hypothetical protein